MDARATWFLAEHWIVTRRYIYPLHLSVVLTLWLITVCHLVSLEYFSCCLLKYTGNTSYMSTQIYALFCFVFLFTRFSHRTPSNCVALFTAGQLYMKHKNKRKCVQWADNWSLSWVIKTTAYSPFEVKQCGNILYSLVACKWYFLLYDHFFFSKYLCGKNLIPFAVFKLTEKSI